MIATKPMTATKLKTIIFQLLGQIAPEADFTALDPDQPIQSELDIDSFDFLNFLIGLNEEVGVEIPEADYGQVATLNALVSYVMAHSGQ
ncbi:MAG: acyl carrier protein [Caldilineaceae bacterium]|nr:acyl carrier protein [Caldilineaceae bacterium]